MCWLWNWVLGILTITITHVVCIGPTSWKHGLPAPSNRSKQQSQPEHQQQQWTAKRGRGRRRKKTPNAQRAHAYHPFESMLAGAKISYHIQFCLFALSLASSCCLFVLDFAVSSSWPLKLFDLKWTKNLCARSFVHLARNVPMFDYSKQFQVCGTYILMKRNERQRMNTKREKQHTSDQQIEGSHIE